MKEFKDWAVILFIWSCFVIGLILFSKPAKASVTFTEAKKIFANIQNTAGVHTVLKLDPSLEVNAYSNVYAVFVNKGMLNFCNKSQLAMVLGHELTHVKYKDAAIRQYSSYYELRADREGYYYCKKAGYKGCLSFLLKMKKVFGDEGNKYHPKWSIRYEALRGK